MGLLFKLLRTRDVSGVSGTGVVAEGLIADDGTVALRWLVGNHRSWVIHDNIDAVLAIHGHDGASKVVVDDSPLHAAEMPPNPPIQPHEYLRNKIG